MMNQWYDPFKISEWFRRTVSVLNLTMLLIAAVFLFSELRFDWCERIIGRYLATSNSTRPETGAVWKVGKQASNAHTYLNAIVNEHRNTERYAREAASFSDLASGLLPGQWTTLDKNQFKKFYLAMPASLSSKIIQPMKLVWLLNREDLKRIFCEGNSDGMEIYFLDADNRVIHQINFNKIELAQLEQKQAPFKGRLESLPGFEGHIYPAAVFFKALLSLPDDMITSLIPRPEKLFIEKGRLVSAGISDQAESGYIRLGFEFDSGTGEKVVFIKGREWAVWRLNLLLAGEHK